MLVMPYSLSFFCCASSRKTFSRDAARGPALRQRRPLPPWHNASEAILAAALAVALPDGPLSRIGAYHLMEPPLPTPLDAEALQRLVSVEMPYGKYKGRKIGDLPGPYLAWFAREGFPPGELGRLLALMHEIDHNGLASLLAPLRRG